MIKYWLFLFIFPNVSNTPKNHNNPKTPDETKIIKKLELKDAPEWSESLFLI